MVDYNNIIVLRSVWGPVGLKVTIQPCKDPKTGRFPSCVRKVDSHGDMILSEEDKNNAEVLIPENEEITIESGTSFNLDDPYECARWEAIKHCPLIVEYRDQRDGRGRYVIDGDGTQKGYVYNYNNEMHARLGVAEFYVEHPQEEVENKISKKKKIHDACTYVYSSTSDMCKKVCKILGHNMTYSSDADVREYLLGLCERTPDSIIELFTGTDTNLRLLFIDALDRDVIVSKDGLYFYGDNVLGGSREAVVDWMKDPNNLSVLNQIKKEVIPLEIHTVKDDAPKKESETRSTRGTKTTTSNSRSTGTKTGTE